jgi:glutamate-ammonia-ligase adenylyltransferase
VVALRAPHHNGRANVGNIALLQRAQACGLLPAPVGDNAALAYRTLRQIQHRARLNEEPTQVDMEQAQFEREAGLALWAAVFG